MKRKKWSVNCKIILALLFLAAALPLVSQKVNAAEDLSAVVINGVEYNLERENYGIATIGSVRLPKAEQKSELYIPNTLEYQGKTYKIGRFVWENYNSIPFIFQWKPVEITDKDNSYHSYLKKITFAKGIQVVGYAMEYDALEQVVCEDPNSLCQAYFYKCPLLQSIYLPKDMQSYSVSIKECPKVKVTVDGANPYIKEKNNDIYSKNGRKLINVTGGPENYKVEEGVNKIDWSAFCDNGQIKTVTIPDSVTIITSAFKNMPNLTSVKISNSVNRIWLGFEQCPKLKKIDLPKKVTEIHGYKDCPIKKIRIHAKSIKSKQPYLQELPKSCKIYVENFAVKKQVKKAGFKGKIYVGPKVK